MKAVFLLPLCTVDEVRAELAETDADLQAMLDMPRVRDRDRWNELRETRLRWRDRLAAQLAEMETTNV